MVLDTIISSFWFLLPAGLANMSPVLFRWLPLFNIPIDLNKTFRGKPIFGKNKTYRGFIVGTLVAIITIYLEKIFGAVTIVDYNSINIILLGFLLGFGALFGDLIESFFKRQREKKPGDNWFPFDQTDWIFGALLFAWPLVSYTWEFVIITILLFGLLHPTFNYIGYLLKLRKNKI